MAGNSTISIASPVACSGSRAAAGKYGTSYMLLLALMGTGWCAIDQLLVTIIPITLRKFTQDAFLIACILNVHRFFGFLIQPYVAWKGDHIWTRFGRRRPFLLWALPGALLFVLLFGLLPELIPQRSHQTLWALLLVAAVFVGMQFCQETCMGCDAPLYADSFPHHMLGRAFSYRQVTNGLMSILMLCFALHWADFNEFYAYLACAFWLAIATAIAMFAVREEPRPRPQNHPRYRPLRDAAMLRDPVFRTTTILACISLMIMAAFGLFHSLYITQTLGLSKGAFGWATTPAAGVGLLLGAPVGILVDRVGTKHVLAAGFILSALASFLMSCLVRDFTSLLIVSLISAAGVCAQLVSIGKMTFQSAGENDRGKVFGLIQLLRTICSSAICPLIGLAVKALHNDYRVSYITCIGLSLAGLAVLLRLPEPRRDIHPGQ